MAAAAAAAAAAAEQDGAAVPPAAAAAAAERPEPGTFDFFVSIDSMSHVALTWKVGT